MENENEDNNVEVAADDVLLRDDYSEAIYSNFDHVLEVDAVEALQKDKSLRAQHAAYNFCGFLGYFGSYWAEVVMRYGSVVCVLVGDSPMECIREANERFGDQ